MLHYRCEMQRLQHAQARSVEAVAFGYSGCKSEKGGTALQRILKTLRGG